ncbi:cap-specific mRNA (nucleoside-2'-O-)-methyltransferase 1-like [Polyergus mexicanus]|uniref:cap-specific mRNA (nucleoside-2'-O-)-methyltransferase 1-like n=1 Tax=Polyergus mexicanus TaxID=615972 RepID=UPI0038B499A8
MANSTDEDSVLSNEDMKLRTADLFNNYSQDDPSDPHYSDIGNIMSAFDNDDNYLNPKKRSRHSSSSSSSSDDNNGQQYGNPSSYEYKMNDSNHDESVSKRRNKRKKLNSGDAIDSIENEKHTQKIELANDMLIYESKNNLSHTSKAQNMMTKMGYKPGKGLGKDDQGRVEPLEAITQRGRRGFGHYVPGLKEASLKWNPEEEEIKAVEDIEWLPNVHSHMLLPENMVDWIKTGPKKLTIDDETMYCNPDILEQIIKSKTVFDKLDKVEMRKARTRSNPYETIRTANFLNRAAVKMANIDRACNFMFTDPKDLQPNKLLYFADVCAGPGGFSEYILSRKKWHAKGFGFTLKNENDFTLDEFFAGPCETFHPFYGSKGNGDVFDPQNQEEFRSLIMKHTDGKGVHFMMSDGGFSVEGQENIQEILSKQLYLCQCLVALMIVRPSGHFVTKLFDLFTPFSIGLVYLMYRCFENICIFKPNTSRPANSERYLICKTKKDDTQAVVQHLSHVNHSLLKKDDKNDIIQLVPLDVLEADKAFVSYLRSSNDTLGKKQIIGLLKIAAFCEDPMLTEPKQADMRKECLNYWNIPDKTRVRPQNVRPQDKIWEILRDSECFFGFEAQKLVNDNVKSILNQPYNWYCMPCGSGPCIEEDKVATFYLGLGRRKVFRYIKGGKWESIGDVKIELPRDTLVYAELIYESKWTGKYFSKTRALHILDAYMLGGEDVSKRYLDDRYKLTMIFCDALWKPVPNDYVCVRAKERFMLNLDIEKNLRVAQRRVKMSNSTFKSQKNLLERDGENDEEPIYFAYNSVLFLRSVAQPWSRHISKKTDVFYVYNPITKVAEYEIRNNQHNRPREAEADFKEAFEKRIIWHWPNDNLALDMDTLVATIKSSPNI